MAALHGPLYKGSFHLEGSRGGWASDWGGSSPPSLWVHDLYMCMFLICQRDFEFRLAVLVTATLVLITLLFLPAHLYVFCLPHILFIHSVWCALVYLWFNIFHRFIATCWSVLPDASVDVACNVFRNVHVCNTVRLFQSDLDLPDILDACSPHMRAPSISEMSKLWPAVLVTASHMLISRFRLIWCFWYIICLRCATF